MVGAPPLLLVNSEPTQTTGCGPAIPEIFPSSASMLIKTGKPAAYSRDNVPLQVKKHLKISIAGVQEGDFTFVMGFPGRNWRYMISDEVEERMQTTNFMRQHVRRCPSESSDGADAERSCRTNPLCK